MSAIGLEVSVQEFYEFISKHPELIVNVNPTYEPPLITYNNFSLGNWPDSVVAYHHGDGSYYHIVSEEATL